MIQIYNKRAKFDYEFLRKYDAGIILTGMEVKSIRNHIGVSFNGAYCFIQNNEIYVNGLTILNNTRYKLLLKKREIKRLSSELIKGTTIVPYRLFEQENGRFKLEIQLARGKNTYDKRETIKERDLARDTI